MSLLDDVSIVVTPNGYKAGTLFAVKPTIAYGSELVVNGDFSQGATGWTIEAVWTISGGAAHGNGANGSSQELKQTILEVGKSYEFSYEIRNRVSGSVELLNSGLGSTSSNEVYKSIGIATSTELRFRPSSFNGEIYNVSVREFTGADMDVTRATAATRVDENGLVNYAEIIGDSILTGNNSNFDTGIGSWVTYNGATLAHSTDKLEVTLTSGESGARIETNSLISGGQSGKTFKVRARIWQGTTTATALKIFIGGAQENITISSTPTYFEVELTAASTSKLIIYRPSGIGGISTFFIDDITVKEAARDNVPRIDYTGGGCPHILAEPQRTNLITYSEDFSNAIWQKQTGIVPTYNTTETLSPDGTNNATKFIGTGSTGVFKSSVSVSGNITRSVYLKSVSGTTTAVFKDPNATGGATPVNLTITNDWQRFELTGDNGTAFQGLWIDDITSDGLYMWGAQLEEGSYPTSYIPTSGSTVTRNQDQFTRDGIGSLINSTEGVLFVEMAALSDDGVAKYLTMNDGSSNNDVRIYFNTTSNGISALLKSTTGATQAFLSYTVTDTTEFHKIAFVYAVNRFELWVDGEKRAEDLSGIAPVGLTTLEFSRASNLLPLFAKVKQLQVYNTALTDEQLTSLTT